MTNSSNPGRRSFLRGSLGAVGALVAGCHRGSPAPGDAAPADTTAPASSTATATLDPADGGAPSADAGATVDPDEPPSLEPEAPADPVRDKPAEKHPPGEEVFALAPMAAEVTASSVILWTRTKVPCSVAFEISLSEGFESPRRTPPITTRSDKGLVCNIPVAGLVAGKRYHYRPVARTSSGEIQGQAGRFFTLPKEDLLLRLVWGADLLASHRPFRICDKIAKLEPDLFLMLGDTTYADWPKKKPPARTLDEFRQKQMDVRESPHLQRLLTKTATYAVWDDHEVGNNDDRRDPRFQTGRQAFLDHWPLAVAPDGGFYRSFSWGTLLDVFILDCRSFRSPATDPDGPKKSMLGARQKQWLFSSLRKSRARYKVIASTVPFLPPFGVESWPAYANERDQIKQLVKSSGIGQVLVLSADFHLAWDLADDASGFRELVCGPLGAFSFAWARKHLVQKVKDHGRFHILDELNFGVLDLEVRPKTRLVAKIFDAKGKERHRINLG